MCLNNSKECHKQALEALNSLRDLVLHRLRQVSTDHLLGRAVTGAYGDCLSEIKTIENRLLRSAGEKPVPDNQCLVELRLAGNGGSTDAGPSASNTAT